MYIPPQGFRHAVDLLLKNGIRASKTPRQLAEDAAALAGDMKAPPEAAEWVAAEFERLLGRDVPVREIVARIGKNRAEQAPRDCFLIYVPEDRLSIAGPLAVELTKRRVSVAFSEYEVASRHDLDGAVERGLAHNRAGALLATPDFERKPWRYEPDHPRLLILRNTAHPRAVAEQLVTWLSSKPSGTCPIG
jgi:hypothetical protein